MSNQVIVHKHRANTIQVDLGFDVSGDVITSEIRTEPSVEAPLILTWDVQFLTDGADGKLVLTTNAADTDEIAVNSGYMDLKRVIGGTGDPVPVFDQPLEVVFRGTVTG